MFSKNTKFCDWRQRLEKRGVSIRVLWSAKSHPSQRYDDIALISFVGNRFQPTEATAVIQNYNDEGFAVWFQSHTGDIEEETAHIAAPRNAPPAFEHTRFRVSQIPSERATRFPTDTAAYKALCAIGASAGAYEIRKYRNDGWYAARRDGSGWLRLIEPATTATSA